MSTGTMIELDLREGRKQDYLQKLAYHETFDENTNTFKCGVARLVKI